MSLVTGYLKQIAGVAANDVVTIRAAVFGVVTLSGALISPGTLTVRARSTDGFWSATLTKGTYEISAVAANGQTAKVTITIPDEDELTYAFEELVVSSLPLLEEPVGGARPTADAVTLGLVRTDETVIEPVASMGFVQVATVVALRAVKSVGRSLKRAWVTAPAPGSLREWYYDVTSVAVDDGTDGSPVLEPDDAVGAGRWLPW